MSGKSRSLSQEIMELINMVEDVDKFTDDHILEKAIDIKKMFNYYITDNKKNGTLTLGKLENIRTLLMENYNSVKLYSQINEVIEKLAMEYEVVIEEYEKDGRTEDAEKLKKHIFDMHTKTFGNEGSHPENFPPSYLERIIRAKIDSRGINNPEIINILQKKFRNTVLDLEEYQELVDNVIMTAVESNIKTGSPTITNASILTIIRDHALTYKDNGDIEKCKEIIDAGLQLKMFEEDERYDILRKTYPKEESIIDVVDLKEQGFETLDLSDLGKIHDEEELFNAFFEKLKVIPAFSQIFETENDATPRLRPDEEYPIPPTPKEKNIIPKEIKLKNIFRILRNVQQKYPNVDITRAYVGKDAFLPNGGDKNDIRSFEDYVIFEVDNSGQAILECFSETSEGALFIVDMEDLSKVISMRRTDAKKEDYVFSTSHDNTNIDENTNEKVYKYITNATNNLCGRIEKRMIKVNTELPENKEKHKSQDKKTNDIEINKSQDEKTNDIEINKSQDEKNNDMEINNKQETSHKEDNMENDSHTDEKDRQGSKKLEDMSTQELLEYSAKLDKDIQVANDENAKIKEEIEETFSAEERFRKDLIERIIGKKEELQEIRNEQEELRKKLAEKQEMMKDAKKRIFGDT